MSLIRAGLAPFGARVLDTDFVEDANWLESWRQYAVQECFAGRLWLLPRDAPPVAQPALTAPQKPHPLAGPVTLAAFARRYGFHISLMP